MRLLVLGGSGRTGRLIVESALRAGHEVTVLVRDPSRMTSIDGVRVLTGDATVEGDLALAVDGQQGVISALGSSSVMSSNIVGPAAAVLVLAAEAAGVRRVLLMSAFGIGSTADQNSLPARAAFATVLRSFFRDKSEAERIVRTSSLDWTIVQPVELTDEDGAGEVVATERRAERAIRTVSRADVAEFLVSNLESSEWSRKSVVISATRHHH